MKDNKKRVLILDCLNLFLRSYVVDPSISQHGNHVGTPIGGLFGTLKSFQKIVREVRPDRIIAVWDGEGGSLKRRAINKNYKMGRKAVKPKSNLNRAYDNLTDDEEVDNKFWQLARVADYFSLMPITQVMVDTVEADDIIAHLCQHREFEDWNICVVSADKDFFQLANDRVIIYRPAQKEIMTKTDILERFDIHPNNFALARAVVGDNSDNLKGVDGVGIKTVAKRFPFLSKEKFRTVDDLIDHSKNMNKKRKFPLQAYTNVLMSSKKIVNNYKMMQLYRPMLDSIAIKEISSYLKNNSAAFSRSKLELAMLGDGIGDWGWTTLYHTFNSFRDKRKEEKNA